MTDPYIVAGHIRRSLRVILDLYDEAADPPKIVDDSEARGGQPDRPPTDVHAIDVRADTMRHVTFWVRFILDVVQDGEIKTKVNGHDLPQMIRFIDTWALALAEQHPNDASGHKEACREELTSDARRLKAIVHGTRTRSIEVGPCPEVILDDEAETFRRCDGTVVANLTERDPDNEEDGLLPQHLTCTVDRTHTWQPWQWADIGNRIERMAG